MTTSNLDFDILIIEDEPLQRFALTELCEKWGHKVLCAKTGEEAVSDCLPHLCWRHIVFCDMELGDGISGLEIGRAIREKHPNLLLIGMSSNASYEEKSLQAGFSFFLEKPITKKHLKKVLLGISE